MGPVRAYREMPIYLIFYFVNDNRQTNLLVILIISCARAAMPFTYLVFPRSLEKGIGTVNAGQSTTPSQRETTLVCAAYGDILKSLTETTEH